MRVSAINHTNSFKISFGAGKCILFTDFDGTFLPQSLRSIYNGSEEEKKSAVQGFNKYFSDFQDFITKTRNKFEIIITTGRRLNKQDKDGFLPTYQKMKEEGIKLPNIKELITSSGGDIYSFSQNGDINPQMQISKNHYMKKITGWDNDLINKTLKDISKELNVDYELVDDRGSYKLSLNISNKSKIDDFYSALKTTLEKKIKCKVKMGSINLDDGSKTYGIKLYPLIDGIKLNKSIDTKIALQTAIQNNDFIVIAGDASNDKEMLNIFNYIKMPNNKKIPTKASEITFDYILQTKKEIDALPIKLLFIKPTQLNNNDAGKLELYSFMQKQANLFPEKVSIVDETILHGENNFLKEIKKSIKNYAEKNQTFKEEWKNILNSNIMTKQPDAHRKNIIFFVISAITLLGIGIYKKFFANQPYLFSENKK